MLNLPKTQCPPLAKVFLCFGFLIFSFSTVNAQINNNRFRVNLNSLDMGPCGGSNDAHTRVGVLAKNNTVNNFEIAFDLPDGVDFIPGSERITFQEGSSDFTLTVVDMSNLNAPVFRLERPGDANWQVADLVRFRFDKTASCDAVTYSYSGGLFKDAHTITYNDNNGSQTASDNDPTINSYNFLRAYLAVLNYNNVPAEIGDTVTRNLDVSNSGNGSISDFVHNVTVGNALGSYSLSFNGTVLTPISVSGNVYTYNIDFSSAPFAGNIGDGDGLFENEIMTFEESFEVGSCGDLSVGHQPTWGCSAVEICQLLPPVSAAVVLDTSVPQINVTETINPSNTDLCISTTYGINISNDSPTAVAYDVTINFGFGTTGSQITTPSQNGLWGNDRPDNTKALSNFRLGGNSFVPDILATTQFGGVGSGSFVISNTLFTSDPDGPGGLEDLDGDGFFDDMAAGESTELTYDNDNLPRTIACGTNGDNYVRDYRVFTDAYASNQCNTLSGTDRIMPGNSFLSRRSPTVTRPSDVFGATPFTVGIQPDFLAGGNNQPFCNGVPMFSNDPSSRWTITLNVPTGVSLDGAPANFTQVDPNTIIYTTTDLPSGSTLNTNIDFPLLLDCGTYAGPQEIPMNYTIRYECACFAEDIYCGTVSGVRSQCSTPCNGPTITGFEAQRETAGWTDDTMTTRVTLDPNIHNLETYMAKDEMVLRTSAFMSNTNPNNLLFDLDYETLGATEGGPDIIQFVSGTVTINDLSSGIQTVPITVAPVLTTNGTTTHTLTFDLSSYTTAISPTYTYGEPSVPLGAPEADAVYLELHFVFEENFTTQTLLELNNFSGNFYDENDVSCNTLGDRVYYFKNRIYPYDRASTNTEGCTETYIELLIEQRSVSGDRFPNEYRPPHIWQSTDLEIPIGATFTGLVTSNDFPGTDPTTTNGGLIVNQVGNTLTISPGPSLREYDQSGNHYPRIRVHFQGSSNSAPSTTVNWTSNYQEFPYSSAPVNQNRSDTHPFNFTQPDYSLTTTIPIVSGDQATAQFEVDLCMDSASDIDFNWLQINNGSDFTIVNAYEVVGAIRNNLAFSEASGNTWVELGQFTSGSGVCKKIEFEVAFTQCAAFDFEVSHAWDCASYPSDFSTANYLNPIDLRLEPKEAVLQMAILDEPGGPVDVCSNFNIDLEIRNAGTGNLINPTLHFDIPGDATSLAIDQVDIEYPQGSGDIQTVTSTLAGNTVTINLIDHTAIASNSGIQGSINASNLDAQIAIIQLDLSVQCNFTSNTAITYTSNGNNPCGTPATGDGSRLSTNPIVVNGAIPFYDAVSALTVPNGNTFSGCATETLSIESVIVGGPTGTTDFARIILPDGLQYESGSFVATTANAATFNSVTVVGNHEEILLNMPSGVNNGEIIGYSVDVTPKNESANCTPNDRIAVQNFVTVNSLSCNGVSCGTSEIPTGDTFEDISIQKPELAEASTAATGSYAYDNGSGNYDYSIEFHIDNTGTLDIASGLIYDVYCSDGSGGKVGPSIYTGTVAQAIASGSSITEATTFAAGSFCGLNNDIIVEFVPSASNCHCDILAIEVAIDDMTDPIINNCPTDITVSNTNAANCGSLVSWTPPTATDNSGTVTLTTNNYNPGDEFLPGTTEVIYTATDPNGNTASCSFFVTVSDDVEPEINGPGDQSLNNTPGTCEAVYNYTLTATDNCLMSTGTYPITADFEEGDRALLRNECWQFWGSTIQPSSLFGPGSFSFRSQQIISTESRTLISPLTYFNGTGQIIFDHLLQNVVGNNTRLTVSLEDEGGSLTPIYNYVYVDTNPQNVVLDITQTGNYRVRFDFDTDGSNNPQRRTWLDNLSIPGIDLSNTADNPGSLGVCGRLDFVITQTAGLSSGSAFPVGVTTNSFEVVDAYGNIGTYSFDVEVLDSENPTASDPAPLVFECPSDVPAADSNVVIDEADNCTANPTVAFVSESTAGSNPMVITRIYSVTDDAGNSIQVQHQITVQDGTDPSASDPATSNYQCPSDVPAPDPSVVIDEADNCTVAPIVAFVSESSSGVNPNVITRIYSVSDDSGNSINVQHQITVQDTEAPIPDIDPLPEIILECDTAITVFPEATDNCTGTIVGTTSDPLTYSTEGSYVLTWTYDDGNGNSTQQTQNVIVDCSVDIAVEKTADITEAVLGDTIVFTITAENLSLRDATNIGIEESIPNGFDFISASESHGNYDLNTSTWNIPSLVSGEQATLEITVTVVGDNGTTNIAELIFLDQVDTNPANDRDEVSISVTQDQCLTIYNEFSPNNDGANEVFFIECIENYPDNFLQVFNRWGNKVFEQEGYDNTWDGTSFGRATINVSEKLPVGTYYYTLELRDGVTPPKSGWLYITR